MSVTNRRIVSAEDSAKLYPTPAWATHALLDHETFHGDIWEPACGNGAMAKVITERGHRVFATDLHSHGYGYDGCCFLNIPSDPYPNIITNPPYPLAEQFVERALSLATRKVAMLLRLAFLEGAGRATRLFLDPDRRPSRVWVFSERITFYPEGVRTGGSGTTAYAWFVWNKAEMGAETVLRWIPPGQKGRHGG